MFVADRLLWRGQPSQAPWFQRRMARVHDLHRHHAVPVTPLALTELGSDATREDFLAASDQYRRPVVLRGFIAGCEATRCWTDQTLRTRFDGRDCTVLRFDSDQDWDTGAPTERMPFGDYLDRMRSEPLYLNSSTELASEPVLQALGLDRVLGLRDPRVDVLPLTNLFIGSDRVHSALHAAPAGNFFLNAVGRKRWTLTDPAHSALLAPVMRPPYQYVRSAFGGYRSHGERLRCLPRFEVVLQPGDVLYNAPWWWHEVDNLDPLTVGCSVRRVPALGRASASWANQPLFTACSLYPWTRVAVAAHTLYARVSPNPTPLRELMNRLNTRVQERVLRKA